MNRFHVFLILISVSLSGFCKNSQPIPVIFDTDIGSDVDDTWALSLILKSPEFDLKLVTTATEDTRYRAKIAAKFLEVAKRTDIPVGIGPGSASIAAFQKPWVTDYDIASYPGKVYSDGVGKLIETVEQAKQPVTIIVAGPMTNIHAALKRAPHIAGNINIVGMHGSIYKGYEDDPSAEYNVANDVSAFRAALRAPWKRFTITPLDTCGDMTIEGTLYQQLRQSEDPQLHAIFDNFSIWAEQVTWDKVDYADHRTSVLYDVVAVYLALPSHPFLTTTPLSINVTEAGFLRPNADNGHTVNVALAWRDKQAFKTWFTQRMLANNK